MGRTLSMAVVAQGVETKEQADFLLQNSCDEIQGFYFNASLSASQVAELVGKQSVGKQSTSRPVLVSGPSRALP
jgi:EAL domain-containing protein (putative c-di-GMP-specific phosphodiesterase class I)